MTARARDIACACAFLDERIKLGEPMEVRGTRWVDSGAVWIILGHPRDNGESWPTPGPSLADGIVATARALGWMPPPPLEGEVARLRELLTPGPWDMAKVINFAAAMRNTLPALLDAVEARGEDRELLREVAAETVIECIKRSKDRGSPWLASHEEWLTTRDAIIDRALATRKAKSETDASSR